jgi:hypothetical protein
MKELYNHNIALCLTIDKTEGEMDIYCTMDQCVCHVCNSAEPGICPSWDAYIARFEEAEEGGSEEAETLITVPTYVKSTEIEIVEKSNPPAEVWGDTDDDDDEDDGEVYSVNDSVPLKFTQKENEVEVVSDKGKEPDVKVGEDSYVVTPLPINFTFDNKKSKEDHAYERSASNEFPVFIKKNECPDCLARFKRQWITDQDDIDNVKSIKQLVNACRQFQNNSECDCTLYVDIDGQLTKQIKEREAAQSRTNAFYSTMVGLVVVAMAAPALIPAVGLYALAPTTVLFAGFLTMFGVSLTGKVGSMRSWFYRYVFESIYSAATSETVKSISKTKKKVMSAVGMGKWSNSAQNVFLALFSGVTLTAVSAIIYVTYRFIKDNKKKIQEGATPMSLAPAFLKKLGLALGVLGVAGVVLIQSSAMLNALRNLSSFGKSMYEKSKKTIGSKGSVVSQHMPLKTLIPLLKEGVPNDEKVYISEELRTAVMLSAVNRLSFGVPLHDIDNNPLSVIGDRLTSKLLARYPGLEIKTHKGIPMPSFDSSIGQKLLEDIKGATYVRRDTDFIDDYARISCSLGGTIKGDKFVPTYSYYAGSTKVTEMAASATLITGRFSQFYREILGYPDLSNCEVYVFCYRDVSVRVYSSSTSLAKQTLNEIDEDMTLLETFVLLKKNVESKWKIIGGLCAVILVVFIGYFYYYERKWCEKEGPGKQSKGQNIKNAEDQRWKVKQDDLIKLRAVLRDNIDNAQRARSMDIADGDTSYVDEYDKQISSLQFRLGDVDETIQAIYDGEYSETFTPKGKKNKNANQDKSKPNSDKSRKVKEGQGCVFKDCKEDNEGKEVCTTHYRQLAYKNTDPSLLPPLTKYLIKNIKTNIKGQGRLSCGYVTCTNFAKSGEIPFCKYHEKAHESNVEDVIPSQTNVQDIEQKEKKQKKQVSTEVEKPGKDTETKQKESVVPGPSIKKLKPVYRTVPESVVSEPSNQQSSARQVPVKITAPIAPIYILRDRGYVRAGVGFLAISQSKTNFYSAWHVVKDGAYIKKGNTYRELKFTQIGSDFGVSSDPTGIQGSPFKLAIEPTKNGKSYRLYTCDVESGEYKTVQCEGSLYQGRFRHTSDTFPAQCGSPYVSNNIVDAFHTQTVSGQYNEGDLICEGPDFLNPSI